MKFEHKETLKRHAKKAHGDKGDDIPNLNPFGGFQKYKTYLRCFLTDRIN